MRADTIHHVIPHADPTFLRLLERLPEPPPNSMEQVMHSLPRLHEIFLKLLAASNEHHGEQFMSQLQAQLKWLEQIEANPAKKSA